MIAQLQVKNEELALRTARISEQDVEEVRTEFEQRLAAAERKVGDGPWCDGKESVQQRGRSSEFLAIELQVDGSGGSDKSGRPILLPRIRLHL